MRRVAGSGRVPCPYRRTDAGDRLATSPSTASGTLSRGQATHVAISAAREEPVNIG